MVLAVRGASGALPLDAAAPSTLRTGAMSVVSVVITLATALATVAGVVAVAGHTVVAEAAHAPGTAARAAAAHHVPGRATALSLVPPRTAARAAPSLDPVPAAGKEASRNPGQTNTQPTVSTMHQSESIWLLDNHAHCKQLKIHVLVITPQMLFVVLPSPSPRFKLCLMLSFIRTFLLIVLNLYIAFSSLCYSV
uniref:Uncharacterized protein n=1 Tax=Graphocephala atropunctata TaxID=36148 RepID=A0A1B6LUE7_9HEMI